MEQFIDIAESKTRKFVREIPGSGAAGGLGAGLILFLGAKLQSGIDIVMDAAGFSDRIKGADVILTGEGKIDNQTAFGKTIAGIASRARTQKIPVIAFAGMVEHADNIYDCGITACHSICPENMPVEKAMKDAAMLLQIAVMKVMNTYKFL